MRNQRTHAFGVPLRAAKFRNQVRIGAITHAYTNRYAKAHTRCGIHYTHQRHLVKGETMDCMTCLVADTR